MANNLTQVVVPKTVFIGDKAELHIALFLSGEKSANLKAGQLPKEMFLGNTDENLFSINSVNLVKNGTGTSELVISFTPWVTGEINLPPYRLDSDTLVTSTPVKIESILENQGTSMLQPALPVKFLPGTIYKIWINLILILLFVLAVIRLVIKRKDVALYFRNQKLKRYYKKNRKSTEKQIRDSIKQKVAPSEKAAALQKIMRVYLENRFDWPFTKAETSRIMAGFDEIYQGLLSDEKTEAVENLVSFFIRTDFIRYGRPENSADETAIEKEILDLGEKLAEIIGVLESETVESKTPEEIISSVQSGGGHA